jgi:hypothetical protein
MADEQKDFTKAEFIDEADRLALDNFHLKMQNLQLQAQLAERTREDIMADTQSTAKGFSELRKKLDAKYGIPITPSSVDKTGKLLRPPPAPVTTSTTEN